MKKILITGSNGLLGQKLVSLLTTTADFDIIATARGANRLPQTGNYTYHSLDITDRNQVQELIGKVKPDYIIHTAAMTNVDQCESEKEACWQLNVNAVEYLAEASKKNGNYLLHLSTDFIFDGQNGPYDETAEASPLSFYGESKLAAEQVLLNSSISWAIARTVLVYGIAHDMSRSNIILWVKKSLESQKAIQVVDDQWRTPTLAEDLAMGCYLLVKHEAEGIYNISGKDMLTPYQMALQTADYFNLDKSFINRADSSTFTQPAKRPARTGFIIDKARERVGYNPHSFEEGIDVLARQIQKGASL
ncbi:SDR family oxidoreductase [Rhodocytophaga rosea]|uniref:dTDP-4-dehydrorhamnose reductase n=1 Tax=Rhodocytophaga rosea TaxID=2704465 RepID=A0A6C0GFR6_9BACT|nr:SDR family oxidoreductase [Rhodocytophaga rosea]QHT66891.1 SDR family oxidoreductase [Rhodocytophaga rosea]